MVSPESGSSVSRLKLPPESRESCIVAIECDPLASGLDGKCRKPCIGHQIPAGICFSAEAGEDLPVPLARLHRHTVRLAKQHRAKLEHLLQTAWFGKDPVMCRDPD